MNFNYPKNIRLRFKRDLDELRSNSSLLKSREANIYYLNRGLDYPRFAIGVSKSIASAVERNRVKRLTRDFIRKNWKSIPPYDYSIQFHFRRNKKNLDFSLDKSLNANDIVKDLSCLIFYEVNC